MLTRCSLLYRLYTSCTRTCTRTSMYSTTRAPYMIRLYARALHCTVYVLSWYLLQYNTCVLFRQMERGRHEPSSHVCQEGRRVVARALAPARARAAALTSLALCALRCCALEDLLRDRERSAHKLLAALLYANLKIAWDNLWDFIFMNCRRTTFLCYLCALFSLY